jgi:hypothetical protein
MAAETTKEKLQKLHALLLQEREWAKALAVDRMIAVSKEKQDLIQTLDSTDTMNPEDLSLAEAIRVENKKNAYIFWSALTWIRESMDFLGKQASANIYNAGGGTSNGLINGGLLSGKV